MLVEVSNQTKIPYETMERILRPVNINPTEISIVVNNILDRNYSDITTGVNESWEIYYTLPKELKVRFPTKKKLLEIYKVQVDNPGLQWKFKEAVWMLSPVHYLNVTSNRITTFSNNDIIPLLSEIEKLASNAGVRLDMRSL